MNAKHSRVQHSMQGVFVFVLLGLFAVMSTLMVLLGAQMYRHTVDRATANNDRRMLGAYVRSMVRAGDAAGAVAVERYGDVTALALHELIDGEEYVTWLYGYQGFLYEQFTGAGREFEPQGGTAICPVRAFAPSIEGDVLTVQMVDDADELRRVGIALRCAQ